MTIYMIYNGFVHLVECPTRDGCEAYDFARKKLNIPDHKISPWGEVRWVNGVAKLGWDFNDEKRLQGD